MRKACAEALNRYVESPHYARGDGEEACDAIVLSKGYAAVVIEYKGSVFTAGSKYGGDLQALQAEMEKKLVGQPTERKGVLQLAHSISSLFAKENHRSVRDLDLSGVTKVFPLLITRDEIGSGWFVMNYLNGYFHRALERKKIQPTVTPLFSLSVDHFESFAGALGSVSLCDILEARYQQDRTLRLPFLLPNNRAMRDIAFRAAPTIDEAGEEVMRCARELFETGTL